MKKYFTFFKLDKEANLLDSKLYIMKALLSVATAYFIATHNSIAKLDIISVLFGLMLTLEPVNISGIRSGLGQVYTSILGAISTAIIIFIGGINLWTIAISMAFTLYVCLKINWREVAPPAIFTSIYMTQYIQKTAEGVPSIFLTFRLRMIALGVGVLIAILYNFIFSLVYYRKILYKRIAFLLYAVANNLESTKNYIVTKDKNQLESLKVNIPTTFNNINWVSSHFTDIEKEGKISKRASNVSKFQQLLISIRYINHMNYDIYYNLSSGDLADINEKLSIERLELAIESISILAEDFENKLESNNHRKCVSGLQLENYQITENLTGINYRLQHNLEEILSNVNNIINLLQ